MDFRVSESSLLNVLFFKINCFKKVKSEPISLTLCIKTKSNLHKDAAYKLVTKIIL